MRLGLIGDVHAEDERLAATLVALEQAAVDMVLCTGDLVDGHGDVDRVCALLASQRVHCVRGNHDRWIRDEEQRHLPNAHRMTALRAETIAFLKELPSTRAIDVPGGVLVLCHGVGGDDMALLRASDKGYALSQSGELMRLLLDRRVRYMVGGHTHQPMVRELTRGDGAPPLVVVNPGTLHRDEEPGYAILDTADNRVEMFRLAARFTVMPGSRAVF